MGKLTFGGTAFQIAALALLFQRRHGPAAAAGVFALQAAACRVAGAGAAGVCCRAASRTLFAWTYAYLAAFCFFVPLGGTLVCLGSLLVCAAVPGPARCVRHCPRVALPAFVTHLIQRVTHGGGARLRAQLGNTRAPLPERMNALVAMQSMPTRTASPCCASCWPIARMISACSPTACSMAREKQPACHRFWLNCRAWKPAATLTGARRDLHNAAVQTSTGS